MRSLIILAAALISTSAFATDFSSIGSQGIETGVDYSYLNSSGSPYFAQHQASVDLQLNADKLGSLTVGAGDEQTVTSFRANQTTFSLGYANGVKLGALHLVAGADYQVFTGDVWLPFNGHYSATPTKEGTVSGEASVNLGSLEPYVDYSHSYVYNDSFVSNGDGVSAGAYLHLTKSLNIKVGYSETNAAIHYRGAVAQVNYTLFTP